MMLLFCPGASVKSQKLAKFGTFGTVVTVLPRSNPVGFRHVICRSKDGNWGLRERRDSFSNRGISKTIQGLSAQLSFLLC